MLIWDGSEDVVPVKLAHQYVKVAHLYLNQEPFPGPSLCAPSFRLLSLSSIFQEAKADLSGLPCLLQITLMALVAATG